MGEAKYKVITVQPLLPLFHKPKHQHIPHSQMGMRRRWAGLLSATVKELSSINHGLMDTHDPKSNHIISLDRAVIIYQINEWQKKKNTLSNTVAMT